MPGLEKWKQGFQMEFILAAILNLLAKLSSLYDYCTAWLKFRLSANMIPTRMLLVYLKQMYNLGLSWGVEYC